jgi:hypothetical protein
MVERIRIDNSKLCKYASKPKKGPIKIDSENSKICNKSRKEFTKALFGKDKFTFTDFVIELTQDQADKLEKFIEYCHLIDRCVYCNKKINLVFFRSNNSDEIVMECRSCMSNTIDLSREGKEYVKWFNESVLVNYGVSFMSGFPKYLKCEFGTKCEYCGSSHDGYITSFMFDRSVAEMVYSY